LLDEFNTEELRRQVMTNDKKAKKFPNAWYCAWTGKCYFWKWLSFS
jgi:hypothetical protein